MRCIACGRVMLDRGTHYECSNIFCDYEEEIEDKKPGDRKDYALKPVSPVKVQYKLQMTATVVSI